jgi:2-oxoglutarate dehydrogenase E1 component
VLRDENTDKAYSRLSAIPDAKGQFRIYNSLLSEYGVLGFEYGYALANPNGLVLWEAQFGDFANGAQTMIDQFISAGEQKWNRMNGVVMLLPHGYEGQGPEHSSARLERFLKLSDENPTVVPDMDPKTRTQLQTANWAVVNCTTPANYFHALRRQIHRNFRKPLIVMSPKSLLRHEQVVSSIDEFALDNPAARFQRLIVEAHPNEINPPEKIERLVFCTGKVYYDILKVRQEKKLKNSAIVRLEQISPFPWDKVQQQAKLYPNAKLIWCQEEPMNMGAWTFVYFHMKTAIPQRGVQISYAGRDPSTSPATGSYKFHLIQQEKLINDALINL